MKQNYRKLFKLVSEKNHMSHCINMKQGTTCWKYPYDSDIYLILI